MQFVAFTRVSTALFALVLSHSSDAADIGGIRVWGRNDQGQQAVPGDLGSVLDFSAGVGHVPGDLEPAAEIAAGSCFSLARSGNGAIRAWGSNFYSELIVPSDLGPAASIAAGGFHAAALTPSGVVRCWGWNSDGQLNVPIGIPPVMAVAAGWLHTIALTKTGEVRCWGESAYGRCAVPLGLGTVSDVAAGNRFSLALTCGLRSPAWQSSDLGPFGFTAPAEHLFTGLPTAAAGPVELHVAARGDLDLPTEFLAVTADGTPLSTLFSASGSASDCPSCADRATITISPATCAALAADGEILVRVAPSNDVSAAQCANGSLEPAMVVPEPPVDCNGNGINDHREVTGIGGPNDCDNDDLIDSCEIAYGDLNRDGNINGADLGIMLTRWGPVP